LGGKLVIDTYDKNAQAVRLFDGIARNYEGPAELFSFFQYGRWRRFLVSQLMLPPQATVLDVCTGTGLVARDIARLGIAGS
jgi:ubiquinone/menaquinone biosynthesis C-methylase UbiE